MTTKNFLIGALPRSGTAWIATLLNMHSGVFCYHDLVATATGDSYAKALQKPGFMAVGDCSSAALAPAFDDVQARRVFIERDEEACAESLVKVMGDGAMAAFDASRKAANDWVEKFVPQIISFKGLFLDEDAVRIEEAERLVEAATGLPLNHRVWEFMKHLNVQIEGLSPTYYDGKKLIKHI